jgi:hypothetical protein
MVWYGNISFRKNQVWTDGITVGQKRRGSKIREEITRIGRDDMIGCIGYSKASVHQIGPASLAASVSLYLDQDGDVNLQGHERSTGTYFYAATKTIQTTMHGEPLETQTHCFPPRLNVLIICVYRSCIV